MICFGVALGSIATVAANTVLTSGGWRTPALAVAGALDSASNTTRSAAKDNRQLERAAEC